MKKKYLIWMGAALLLVVLVIGTVALVGSPGSASDDGINSEAEEEVIPQLDSDKRENAETMVLVDAPPVMPPDHERFWDNMKYTGCMACHGNEDTGTPQPSAIHYVAEDIAKGVFKDPQCIQCHATQTYKTTAEAEKK